MDVAIFPNCITEYKYTFGCLRNREQEIKFINSFLNSPKKALDLGSGPFSHLLELSISQSIFLIDINNCYLSNYSDNPNTTIIQQDVFINDLKLASRLKFDLVLCLYGIIYLCSRWKRLHALFFKIRQCMNTGGIFIFDITDLSNYARKFGASGEHYFGSYNIENGSTQYTLNWNLGAEFNGQMMHSFKIVTTEKRIIHKECRQVYHYPLEEIEKTLLQAGFKIIDEYSDFKFTKSSRIEEPRRLFVLQAV